MATPQDLLTLQKKLSDTFGIEADTFDFRLFRIHLADAINDLIQHDFNKLVAILYRVDVAEEKLSMLLRNAGGSDAGFVIADALIERQLQKREYRFPKDPDPDISDKEKW